MAHQTLIDGTVYNITGGQSLVNGTAYNIKSGRTLIGGTKYNINFDPLVYAMLYSDNSFVFQYGDKVESGKTLINRYKVLVDNDYIDDSQIPWNSERDYINTVSFRGNVALESLSYYFYNCAMLSKFDVANLSLDNVTNMYRTYYNCRNLTGSPVCGPNVTSMFGTYWDCTNLTGSPVCGNHVIDMNHAYRNCRNLIGSPVCGPNVTNMANTYTNCKKLWGNAYFLSPNVANVANCFYGRNVRKRLNIYVQAGSTTNTVVHYNNTFSLTGASITWTNAGSYQYNTASNIYIYPVANVISTGIQKGDLKQ